MNNDHAEELRALRSLLRRTYGRIKDVEDPRARRAAGELKRKLGVPNFVQSSKVAQTVNGARRGDVS